jgi:hypothetical protein
MIRLSASILALHRRRVSACPDDRLTRAPEQLVLGRAARRLYEACFIVERAADAYAVVIAELLARRDRCR